MTVLITGVSGKLGRMVARHLLQEGHSVLGLDRRPWPDPPPGLEMFQVDVRKRPAENVFRTRKPDAAIHMATVRHFRGRREEQYRINLNGTQAFFRHCANHGVKHAVFIGRHTYYGAAPDVPLYHAEDHPPLAVHTFPALGDLVAADLFAGSAIWRYPEMSTTVLRVCYTLGPTRHGTLARFLRGPRVPTIMGFDPLFQFLHEDDTASAITLALQKRVRGVFNVAGPLPVPLSVLIKVTGRKNIPIPEPLFDRVQGRFGFPSLSHGAVAHLKFPVVMDDSAFREATGWQHRYDEVQTMEAYRWA